MGRFYVIAKPYSKISILKWLINYSLAYYFFVFHSEATQKSSPAFQGCGFQRQSLWSPRARGEILSLAPQRRLRSALQGWILRRYAAKEGRSARESVLNNGASRWNIRGDNLQGKGEHSLNVSSVAVSPFPLRFSPRAPLSLNPFPLRLPMSFYLSGYQFYT